MTEGQRNHLENFGSLANFNIQAADSIHASDSSTDRWLFSISSIYIVFMSTYSRVGVGSVWFCWPSSTTRRQTVSTPVIALRTGDCFDFVFMSTYSRVGVGAVWFCWPTSTSTLLHWQMRLVLFWYLLCVLFLWVHILAIPIGVG